MKKIIILGLLIVLSVFVITGCKNNDETDVLKLRIKESSWSGWTPDYEPEEITKEYDVVLGKEYSINSGKFIFVIEEINDDNIVIKTSEVFSDNKEGIDLNTDKTRFTRESIASSSSEPSAIIRIVVPPKIPNERTPKRLLALTLLSSFSTQIDDLYSLAF